MRLFTDTCVCVDLNLRVSFEGELVASVAYINFFYVAP